MKICRKNENKIEKCIDKYEGRCYYILIKRKSNQSTKEKIIQFIAYINVT